MAFDRKEQFGTNVELEIEGVWEDLGEAVNGESPPGLLVARVGNKAYLKEYQKVPRGIRRQLDQGTLPEGMGETIVNKLLAKTILLDWRGIADGGEVVEYSYDNALAKLNGYKDFREFVWEIGNDQARFRQENLEEDLGNSKSASSGNSPNALDKTRG